MAADQPPRPDAGSDDRDGGDRQPQIVVDDPENFAKTRQLRAIFDAKDDYIQARRDADRAYEDDEISFADKHKRIFRHMQDFAMTMEPLLKRYESGREIWEQNEYSVSRAFTTGGKVRSFKESVELCQQIVQNADQIEQIAEQAGYTSDADGAFEDDVREAQRLLSKLPNEADNVDGTHPAFKKRRLGGPKRNPGLEDVKENIKEEFRVFATPWGWSVTGLKSLVRSTPKLEYRTGQTNTFRRIVPPRKVSDKAFSDLGDFIAEMGLGVQFDETQQTKIDDDLLKEVDQWRQTNTN